MSVTLGPGLSIVIRKDALRRIGYAVEDVSPSVGDLVSQDEGLVVLGPLFETDTGTKLLTDLGLEYFQDFFDIPHDGGPVAEWCQIELRIR